MARRCTDLEIANPSASGAGKKAPEAGSSTAAQDSLTQRTSASDLSEGVQFIGADSGALPGRWVILGQEHLTVAARQVEFGGVLPILECVKCLLEQSEVIG